MLLCLPLGSCHLTEVELLQFDLSNINTRSEISVYSIHIVLKTYQEQQLLFFSIFNVLNRISNNVIYLYSSLMTPGASLVYK